jgi:hypothetical protein
MLKTNLIAIAIITLGLGITSAFGQAADWEIKPAVKTPKTTIKNPKQVQPGNSGGTITNQIVSNSSSRTKKTVVSSTNQKLEAVRKPKSTKGMTEYVDNDEYRTKKPARKGSKGKRQHKP